MPVADHAVLDYIAAHPGAGREDIRKDMVPQTSGPTMWRTLKRLTDEGKLTVTGKARATGYTIAGSAVVRAYLQAPYNRRPPKTYNSEFLDSYVPDKTFYLSAPERERLHEAGRPAGPALTRRHVRETYR